MSVGDLLFEKGPLGDLARKAAEELGGVSEMVDVTDSANKTVCVHQPTECEGDVWCVHCHEFLSWSTRIPAAIQKAKELTEGGLIVICERDQYLTAGEAALAEGYWARYCTAVLDSPVGTPDEEVPPELIAFAEKVEKLT